MAGVSAATNEALPWTRRSHTDRGSRRGDFTVDRDRIVHCDSFRELQYKTQVQSLLGGREGTFRTRLNHVLEVAQISRAIAHAIGATEDLAEAIALAHDLGHPPFGHAGERALRSALVAAGRPGWNANVHSLDVVDMVECSFIKFRGLNLTWATREGIARHSTPFDEPVSFGEFAETRWGGLECQIADAADVLAYLAHDLDDAVAGGYLDLEQLATVSPLLRELVQQAEEEWNGSEVWPLEEHYNLIRRAAIARLIGHSIIDLTDATLARIAALPEPSPEAVRRAEHRVVDQSHDYAAQTRTLLKLLTDRYYRSDAVSLSDQQAVALVQGLFDAMLERHEVIPKRFERDDIAIAVATYLASLNDHGALHLARELGVDQAATLS
jgi:dGTPase